jgi:hypothetical protein
MKNNKKELYIIGGVSGAIGNAVLALLSRKKNAVIYGLSRQMQHYSVFEGKLPLATMGISVGEDVADRKALDEFVGKIDFDNVSKVHYVHALGKFAHEFVKPTDKQLREIEMLSYDAFVSISDRLLAERVPFATTLIGSLSDKYKIKGFQSWWKTIERTKNYMKSIFQEKVSMNVVNIASIVSSQELRVRPLVFAQTEAKPYFWLTPYEVAEKIISMLDSFVEGYSEDELFHKSDYWFDGYYDSKKIRNRRLRELNKK